MSPLIYRIGPLEIRAFTFWLALGVLTSAALVCALAWRRRERILPYLDVTLAMVVFGSLGARIVHVALNWDYFAVHQAEIWSLEGGGLAWHGALLGGLLGAGIASVWRGLSMITLADRLALTVPILAATIWMASVVSNNAYGVEVRSLADFPAWMVVESPDIYGNFAPRVALANIGVSTALVLFLLLSALDVLHWLSGLRLWIGIALYALCMAMIGFFRADPMAMVMGRRADQLLDLGVLAVATIGLISTLLVQRRRLRRSVQGVVG